MRLTVLSDAPVVDTPLISERAADPLIDFLQNATVWTGSVSGLEVFKGDILLDNGLVKRVGTIDPSAIVGYTDIVRVDAGGKWVSPGYVVLYAASTPWHELHAPVHNHRLAQPSVSSPCPRRVHAIS